MGKRQSPINIETAKVVGDVSLVNDPFMFDGYSGSITGDFFNNGHTVQFTISKTIPVDKRPRIYGGGLGPKGYIFEQFHFHWGNTSQGKYGAEHTIGKKFLKLFEFFQNFWKQRLAIGTC